MLVITRKLDQSIIINGNVEVVVTGISKDGVRLGIIAPREVEVHRREVFEAIAAANRAAPSPAAAPPIQDLAALLRARTPKVRPPSPPSGPRSRIQSAVLMTSRLCSMTTTVLPASTSRAAPPAASGCPSKCRPVVGSSRM
jgi:carbon storage regulator